MALTRKFLTALGIEADKVDEIINAHAETVDALKAESDKYKKNAEHYESTLKELESVKAENAELKKDGAYKEKYEEEKNKKAELQREFDAYKETIKNKETKDNKTRKFRELLKEANVSEKYFDSVIKVSNDAIEKLELDAEGNANDKDKIIESIKSEWADFIDTKNIVGADTKKPPKNSGGTETSDYGKKMAEEFFANKYGKQEE